MPMQGVFMKREKLALASLHRPSLLVGGT